MQDLGISDFSDAVGEAFEVADENGSVTLVLEEASALPSSVRAHGSFRLLFRGPPQPILPQAVHRLRRGENLFDIFIVPLQPDASGVPYEAIFN